MARPSSWNKPFQDTHLLQHYSYLCKPKSSYRRLSASLQNCTPHISIYSTKMSGRSTRSTVPGRGNTGRTPPATPPGAAPAVAPGAASPAAAPSLPDLMTTIQNLQQQVQALQQQQQPTTGTRAPAPAPTALRQPRFALTPARHLTGFLDFDQKANTILYKEATKSLC